MEAEELKRRLAKARTSSPRRYPAELREAVKRYALQRRGAGISRDKIATELAMSACTLDYWCGPARSRGNLTPVTIVAEPATASDLFVECGPLRVRGLDVATLAELLRRLA